MTDFTGAFDLRKVLVRWSRAPSGGVVEDSVFIHFHLLQWLSGAPAARWSAADYTACEARLDTWWNAIKTGFPTWETLSEYRWYDSGPTVEPEGGGVFNPAVRSTTRAVAGGTGAAGGSFPPQVALTHTFETSTRKRWGRVYLPCMATSIGAGTQNATVEGRLFGTWQTTLHNAMVALLNGFRTDGFKPVVWSRQKSAYTTPKGNPIGFHTATAYEITSVQTDNVFDVVRSRRWSYPTVRSLTALT